MSDGTVVSAGALRRGNAAPEVTPHTDDGRPPEELDPVASLAS
jgi:hypothetical protein